MRIEMIELQFYEVSLAGGKEELLPLIKSLLSPLL